MAKINFIMKLCRLRIHNYKSLGTQSASNIVGGFSQTQLQREVLQCKCGKVKYIGFDIATNSHLDNSLKWTPILTRQLRYIKLLNIKKVDKKHTKLPIYCVSEHFLEFEEWYDLFEDSINLELAETGADREMDFDPEREFDNRYEMYLNAR
jgi:hypothetical protein